MLIVIILIIDKIINVQIRIYIITAIESHIYIIL